MTEEAKPATDEQMAAMRAYLKTEGSPRRWSRHSVVILIARIDVECAARRAAEARVKVLEEALRHINRTAEMSAAVMRDAERTGGWDGAERVARAFERIAERAALKEPANG